MATAALSEYEAYCLDVSGYIVLPSALTEAELDAVRNDVNGDAVAALGTHPTLARYANVAMTPPKIVREVDGELPRQFKADGAPHVLADTGGRLAGGAWLADGHRSPSKYYTAWAGQQMCAAVRAFFIIDLPARPKVVPADGSVPQYHDGSHGRSSAGLGLAQGSHNSWIAPPPCLADDPLRPTDAEDLLHYPDLRPGDLVFAASALMYSYSAPSSDGTGIAVVDLIHQSMRPSGELDAAAALVEAAEAAGPAPEWMDLLSPTQRAVLGWGDDPSAAVLSDGQSTWLGPADAPPDHPPILTPLSSSADAAASNGNEAAAAATGDCLIDPAEVFKWETQGHLVLRGVMDPAWIAQALEAVRSHPDAEKMLESTPPEPGTWEAVQEGMFGGSTPQGGDGRDGNLLALPSPHGDAFRRMIDCPAIVSRLRWMLGSGFGVANGVGTLYGNQGSRGIFLHAGGAPLQTHSHAAMRNGRLHSDYINISWALEDTSVADGGFCTIPGSHKASVPLPGVDPSGEGRFDGQGSIDPVGLSVNPEPLMDDGCLRHVALNAGDVVLFLGAAATHGAMTWRSPRPRRQILFSCYSRANMASMRSKL